MMNIWNRIEILLTGLLGGAALLVGTFQVIGRYLNHHLSFEDGDEIVVYLMAWAVLLASSQLVRTDGHVRPDVVLRLLPPHGQRWLEFFNCCVAILFCGGLAYCSFYIVSDAWHLDERSATGLEFPMWIYYSAMLTGGSLMFIRYIIRLHRLLFRFDPNREIIAIPKH